jgi:hypothetical protein
MLRLTIVIPGGRMTMPEHKRKKSPVDRFRSIISDGQKNDEKIETRKTPIVNLPKAKPAVVNPIPAPSAPYNTPPSVSLKDNNRFLPTFWTVASIVSLTVNAILVIIVVIVMHGLGNLNSANLGPGILGGLYSNFELMDQAHIKTMIPVQTSIPLNMSIPVQTTTGITLAQDVSIQGAHVKINTALFNIDAPASVTLPAGTALNVTMNFNVPVQADVPVTLNVPVDIALKDTDLHPAILGLQETLKPLYCIVSPTALSLSGEPVCR